jgi:hypothetical protein
MLTSCNNIKKTLITTPEVIVIPMDITKDKTKGRPEEHHHPELSPSKDFGMGPIAMIAAFSLVAVPLALLSYWASPDSQLK